MGHTAPAGAESPARYCLSPALFPYGEASARVSPGPAGGGGGSLPAAPSREGATVPAPSASPNAPGSSDRQHS